MGGASMPVTRMATNATTLSTIASTALSTVGTDEQAITSLKGSIDGLKHDIDTMQTWLTASEETAGVSIFVGLAGAMVCFIPGAQAVGVGVLVVGLVGASVAGLGAMALNEAIQRDQDQIKQDQAQISDLNQDVALLQAVNSQFEWLVAANEAAQAAMTTVVQMWQQLDETLGTVQADLTTLGNDLTKDDYASVSTDLAAADTAWQQVVAFATQLDGVSYQWQDVNGNWFDFKTNPPPADSATVTPISTSNQRRESIVSPKSSTRTGRRFSSPRPPGRWGRANAPPGATGGGQSSGSISPARRSRSRSRTWQSRAPCSSPTSSNGSRRRGPSPSPWCAGSPAIRGCRWRTSRPRRSESMDLPHYLRIQARANRLANHRLHRAMRLVNAKRTPVFRGYGDAGNGEA